MITIEELKVFVAGENAFSVNVYAQFMQNINIKNTTVFSDIKSCLNKLHTLPDVILLENNLEDSTGFEILRSIKEINPGIYVVVISSRENPSIAVDALHFGAFDYLVKGKNDEQKIHNVIKRIVWISEEIEKGNGATIRKMFSFN